MDSEISKYKLIDKLASGAFGEIYTGIHPLTKQKVAIKIEKKPNLDQLKYEHSIYKSLSKIDTDCICKIFCFGKILYNNMFVNAMCMELLGPSLEELFNYCSRKFSYKTVLMLGDLMLSRIEYLHYKHYIHRDIKPDNFAFGNDEHNKNNLYILDFGLTKMFRSPSTYIHIPMKLGKSLTGTARYASLNTHLGYEQSRRDDLESLGYCLVYFLKGRLPWQGLPAKGKAEKYEKIKTCKETISVHKLCESVPVPILKFILYVKHLEFDEMPNYLYLKELFSTAMRENKYRYDYEYDWITKMRADLQKKKDEKKI